MDCPNETTLRNFLRGELADDVSNQIVVHVDQCSDCEAVLQRLENEPDPVLDPLHPAFQEGIVGSDSQPADSGLREQWQVLATAVSDANGLPFPDVAPERPQPLGQYELLEPIGRGGMGAVYRARHTKLGRTVAIKILPARSQRSPAAVARFEREMLAVGALNHPHIVHATDAAETNGVHFLVMEHVDGIDVGSLARTLGQLDVPNACEIVRQAALGLQHAHEKGLIHRDVKPSNLILSKEGTVKLLDLGLALLQQDDTPADGLTSTNQVMGTLDYMAPEQADNSHTVDVRADLYSLGATLFRLLTGVAPLDTHNCHTPLQKLSALIHKPRTNITDLRADLPPGLADLVQSLLASNPAERPPSAKEIIERLTPLSQPHRLCDLWRKFTIARDTGSTERPETQFPISSMQSDTGITPPESSRPHPACLDGAPDGELTPTVHPPRRRFDPIRLVRMVKQRFGRTTAKNLRLHPHEADGGQSTGEQAASLAGHLLLHRREVDGGGVKRSRWIVTTALLLTAVALFAFWKRNDWNRIEPDESVVTSIKPIVLFDAKTTEPSVNSTTSTNPAESIPQPEPLHIAWTPGPTENILTGILPAPTVFPDLGRWQIESKAPRGQITDLKWSPDGRWFACASADQVVRVYRADGDKLLFHAILRNQDSAYRVNWSPDSSKLATHGGSTEFRIWEVDPPKLTRSFRWDRNLGDIEWSPDGSDVITVSGQYVARWTAEGKQRWTKTLTKGGGWAAWNPTRPLIAIGGDPTIQILNAETGELQSDFGKQYSAVNALEWSPSGNYLATGAGGWNKGGDTRVRVWQADGKEVVSLQVSGSNVGRLAWSRDEKHLAAGADMVKVWRFEPDAQNGTAQLVHVSDPHPHQIHVNITGLDWSADGRCAFADAYDGIRFWSVTSPQVEFAFAQHGQLRGFAWSPADDRFVTVSDRGVIHVWSANGDFTRSEAIRNHPLGYPGFEASWSPDGNWLAINSGSYGRIAVTPMTRTEQSTTQEFRLPQCSADHLSWSPDSRSLAIGALHHSSEVFLWDRLTGFLKATGKGDHTAKWLGWEKDSGDLVKATSDGLVHHVDVTTGKTRQVLRPDDNGSNAGYAAVSSDLRRLAIWGGEWKVGLRCVDLTDSGRTIWRKDDNDGFRTARWHPTQSLLCVIDARTKHPILLDGETGNAMARFGAIPVHTAFWSADGTQLATLPTNPFGFPGNGTFHLWKFSPTGAALPEVVGVTLPDGLAASFTPGGAPISLTDAAEKHLTWVIEKPNGRFEYLTRAEFEQRVAAKQETSRPPIQESPRPPIIDPQASIRGCMFYWPMNEGRGQTTDSIIFSGQQFAARFAGMSGGPEWTTDSAPVTYDNPAALSFDGIDDSLDSGMFRHPDPTKTSLLKHSMTISFWLKTVERKKMSLGGLYSPTNRNIFFLELNHWESWSGIPVPAMTFGVTDKAATRRYLRGIPRNIDLCDGAWHHLVIAWDDKKASAGVAYVDGENVTLLAENGGTTGWPYDFGPLVAPFEFGVTKVVGDDGTVKREAPFKGLLDEFRIYHRVLTEAEIQKLAARREEPKR